MIYLQLFPLLLKSTLCFSWLANRIGMAIKKLLWVFVSRTTAWKRVRLARTKVIMYTSRGEPIFGTEFCNVLSKKLHNLKVRTIIFALNLNINFDRLKTHSIGGCSNKDSSPLDLYSMTLARTSELANGRIPRLAPGPLSYSRHIPRMSLCFFTQLALALPYSGGELV